MSGDRLHRRSEILKKLPSQTFQHQREEKLPPLPRCVIFWTGNFRLRPSKDETWRDSEERRVTICRRSIGDEIQRKESFGPQVQIKDAIGSRSNGRLLDSVEGEEEEEVEAGSLPHGETGESDILSIPFQVLSWKPRALYFPNFATAEQCQTIIEIAKSKLKPSSLALRKGETAETTKGIRTSSGTFISASDDVTGILDFVERKIAKVTMIPVSHGEAFNILRYEVGQRYVSHYDAFNPSEYGPQRSQRIASFLLYLSDVEEGGETMFPFENGSNMGMGYDYKKCIGLKVKPREGDGLLFYSLFPNGTIDKTSLHGSCPVIKGEKWVATKWIRDQEQYV